MKSLTANEAKVMDFLVRHFDERHSINQVGLRLGISPKGAYKILKKLEGMKAIKPEEIGNAIYYKPNLQEEIGSKMAEFVLVQNELNNYAKVQADDLKNLKDITYGCILFGSVISKGKESRDIDVLLIIDEKSFNKVHKELEKIKEMKPKKIHDVIMTKQDLLNNIKKKDDVILDIIKTGKILWGSDVILEGIRNGANR
jgi:DNA-binding Lrp family transcriptional regulator